MTHAEEHAAQDAFEDRFCDLCHKHAPEECRRNEGYCDECAATLDEQPRKTAQATAQRFTPLPAATALVAEQDRERGVLGRFRADAKGVRP